MNDAPFTAEPLASLATLLQDSGIDSVWLDLDGDLVPDAQLSSYSPDASSAPFDVPSLEEDPALSDEGFEGTEFESWISLPVEEDGAPLFDVIDLLPDQSVPGSDWTGEDAFSYDPMQMWNFSVESGPVVFDSASGDSYCAQDYTAPDLWFNQSSFDQGAGYWDSTYAVMPTEFDTALWQPTPSSYEPNGYDMFSDPFTSPSVNPFGYDGYSNSATGDMGFDQSTASSSWATPGYDSSEYSAWDGSSSMDASNSYFTDYSFDDQLWQASQDNQFWMDEYNDASSLSNDYWQMSADAANAGDSSLAYDYNQLSLDASSYANDAWSYSSSSYDSISSADDGWYSAMSLD